MLRDKIIFALNSTDELYREHRSVQATWKYRGMHGAAYAGDGCYNGSREQCYVVDWTARNERFVEALARKHKQESILTVAASGRASLHYLNTGRWEYQGVIKEVTHYIAAQAQAYTELNGACYIIEEN